MTYVLFALMSDGQSIKNQALAVPMAFKATRFAMDACLSQEVGPFVRYLCHTYKEHDRDISSIYSLMNYAGIDVTCELSQNDIIHAFDKQLSVPHWANLITAVNDNPGYLLTSARSRWYALGEHALSMCVPGAFGRWEPDETLIRYGDDDSIVDTGGLSWLFAASPVQPSAFYRHWVPASYKFGTLDEELFAGISCLTRIPWINLEAISDGQSIAGKSAQRLLFYGLYPDGSCDTRIYDRVPEGKHPVYDGALYSILPVTSDGNGIWSFSRKQILTLD